MISRAHMTLAVAVACAMAVVTANAQEKQPLSELAGVWQLNLRRSDLPKKKEDSSDIHGRFGTERDEMDEGREGDATERESPADRARQHRNVGTLLGVPTYIKIDVQDDQVRIISANGHVRIITPDGKPVDRQREFVPLTETATWEEGRIVVRSSNADGVTIKETIGLDEKGKGRLVHTVELTRPGSDEPRKARWVYER